MEVDDGKGSCVKGERGRGGREGDVEDREYVWIEVEGEGGL